MDLRRDADKIIKTALRKGIEIYQALQDNNAYMALAEADGLIKTGVTGTNVNDVAVLLIQRGNSHGLE